MKRFLTAAVVATALVADSSYGVEISSTAGHFSGWVLDFANSDGSQTSGHWTFSKNLLLTRPKDNGALPSGAHWEVVDVGNDMRAIKCTVGNFKGWVLDFANDAASQQDEGWTYSRNLILTKPRDNGQIPSGGKWKITAENNGIYIIYATAGNFQGGVLDFDNSVMSTTEGGWTYSRNLLLTKPKPNGTVPSGGKWKIAW